MDVVDIVAMPAHHAPADLPAHRSVHDPIRLGARMLASTLLAGAAQRG